MSQCKRSGVAHVYVVLLFLFLSFLLFLLFLLYAHWCMWWREISVFECMYVCMYVLCMYVCMYVRLFDYLRRLIFGLAVVGTGGGVSRDSEYVWSELRECIV